jgi:TPR repeat protein
MALHYAYEENVVETLKWLKKAAAQGHQDAIELLNEIE